MFLKRVGCKYRVFVFTAFTVVSFFISPLHAGEKLNFDPGLAPFSVEANKKPLHHVINFRTLMPGENLNIQLKQHKPGEFTVSLGPQNLKLSARGHIAWVAPNKSGYYPISVVRNKDKAVVELKVFVLVPASHIVNGKLNGYQIGSYPSPLKGLASYRPPKGFIEIQAELENLRVSPHFTLGQFLCKQQSAYPKYLLLDSGLLDKLELLLRKVNSKGITTNSFVVMSGYRTPYYNKAIGNVTNSRHIYGGAADIFIDVRPVDNFMDDINQDGMKNLKDAEYLYNIADKLVSHSKHPELVGGVGLYDKTSAHGPFVHVDVRGTPARWGHQ